MHDQEATAGAVPDTGPDAGRVVEDLNLGDRVGPYRIERRLAAGGMGVVYLASREDDFEQRVALKVVRRSRAGQDLPTTVEVLRRFIAERQILARLEHPNIARIFDGGTTDDALPYFVMEYVQGQPIDDYCEERKLSIVQRLELFLEVCAAVHFAHQNLVVHRDLKPDNILVTPAGMPKLLDFGIARILATEPGTQDSREGRLMTPDYASPEQILGQAITTASDVYSLGVLLYRLVSGRHPYRLQGLGGLRRVERILNVEPEPASTLAQPPPRRRFVGDIDAIIQKAMAKEPRRRYSSALQLAEDLERHLGDMPVTAYSDSWLYRARKLVRRQRLATTFAAILVGFALTVTVLWRQAVDQRREAEVARRSAERVSTFLGDLFQSADPDTSRGATLTAREILDQGRVRLGQELAGEPMIRAELLAVLGVVYSNLALYREAREVKEEALRSRRASHPVDLRAVATDLNNLGRLEYDLGDYAAAEERFREALALWLELDDEATAAFALRNLAAVLMHRGESEEALELHGRLLDIQRRQHGPDHPEIAASLYSLGALHRVRGEPARAEPYLRRALEIFSRSFGEKHTRVAAVDSSLGRVLQALGLLPEARTHLERALAIRRELLGEDHVQVANSRKNLADLLLAQDDPDGCLRLAEIADATLKRARPEGDWMVAEAGSVLGGCLTALGRFSEAKPRLIEGYRTLRETRGADHADSQRAWERLAGLYRIQGQEIPPSLSR